MNLLIVSLSAIISMASFVQDEELPEFPKLDKEKIQELLEKFNKSTKIDDKRGYMGINVGKDESDEKVQITTVSENSPAEKAGLQEGDNILSVDKTDVSEPQELIDYLKDKKPGQTVTLKIERDGKEKTVKVVLGKRNEDGTVVPVDPADAKLDSVYNDLFDQAEKIKKLIEKAEKDDVELLTSILNSINKLKIKTLLRDLQSEDETKKEVARKILLNMGEDVIKELEKDGSDEAKKLLKEIEELKDQIKKLIEELGSDDAEKRDKAEKELVKFGKPALPYLKEAVNDKDLERSTRAKQIIEEIEGNNSSKPPKKEPNKDKEFRFMPIEPEFMPIPEDK